MDRRTAIFTIGALGVLTAAPASVSADHELRNETVIFNDVESLIEHAKGLVGNNHVVLRAYTKGESGDDVWLGYEAWENVPRPGVTYSLRLADGVTPGDVDPRVIYS